MPLPSGVRVTKERWRLVNSATTRGPTIGGNRQAVASGADRWRGDLELLVPYEIMPAYKAWLEERRTVLVSDVLGPCLWHTDASDLITEVSVNYDDDAPFDDEAPFDAAEGVGLGLPAIAKGSTTFSVDASLSDVFKIGYYFGVLSRFYRITRFENGVVTFLPPMKVDFPGGQMLPEPVGTFLLVDESTGDADVEHYTPSEARLTVIEAP